MYRRHAGDSRYERACMLLTSEMPIRPQAARGPLPYPPLSRGLLAGSPERRGTAAKFRGPMTERVCIRQRYGEEFKQIGKSDLRKRFEACLFDEDKRKWDWVWL